MPLTRISQSSLSKELKDSNTTSADADIAAIAKLSDNAVGYLKKIGQNEWAIDSATFITSIPDVTASQIESALIDTGAVIQTVSSMVAATSGTTTVTLNNTLPAITVGVQIWSGTISPAATQSQIYIAGSFGYTSGTSSRQLFAFLFRGNTCIGTAGAYCATANLIAPIAFNVVDSPNTTSAVTYSIRVGGASAHTWRVNQLSTSNFAGTLATSRIVLQELA